VVGAVFGREVALLGEAGAVASLADRASEQPPRAQLLVEVVDEANRLARVDVAGVQRTINIGLLEGEGVGPGDWVLIHVGFALSKIDEREAMAALNFLEGVGQAYTDELGALQESAID